MAPEAQIAVLEEQLRTAMLRSDCEALDRLISAELVFTNHAGIRLTKQDDIAAHASGELQIRRLDVFDQTIRVLGDTAIVCLVAAIEGSYAGNAFSGSFAYTRFWFCSSCGWKIEAVHCSQVPSSA